MFSGSFGVRSIVLCKCSGKYIDIYFILKITFMSYWVFLLFKLWFDYTFRIIFLSLKQENYVGLLRGGNN